MGDKIKFKVGDETYSFDPGQVTARAMEVYEQIAVTTSDAVREMLREYLYELLKPHIYKPAHIKIDFGRSLADARISTNSGILLIKGLKFYLRAGVDSVRKNSLIVDLGHWGYELVYNGPADFFVIDTREENADEVKIDENRLPDFLKVIKFQYKGSAPGAIIETKTGTSIWAISIEIDGLDPADYQKPPKVKILMHLEDWDKLIAAETLT